MPVFYEKASQEGDVKFQKFTQMCRRFAREVRGGAIQDEGGWGGCRGYQK